jgi:hypothetical protein
VTLAGLILVLLLEGTPGFDDAPARVRLRATSVTAALTWRTLL